MRNWIRDHRGVAIGAALLFAALVVFVLVWFQPQGLLFDERVDEALPGGVATLPATATTTTAAPATTTAPTTSPPTTASSSGSTTTVAPTTTTTTTSTTTTTAGPVVLSDTELIDVGRAGTGRVLIVELPDGSRIVRFEDLDVVNGPDLVVILSPSELVDDRNAYDDGAFFDLGELKGNQGNQNYEIPAEVNLDEYRTVAIWCRRFNYTFNAAAIEPMA